MKAILLKQKFYYEIRLQTFDDNTQTITVELDKSIDVSNRTVIREILLDYIKDVRWDTESDCDGGRLSFLNEYGEVGDFYIYIDAITDEALYKTITPLVTLQTLENHISNRDLVEILLTLCFKNFK